MAKTYFSRRSRTQHTYRFYKERRYEPEWKDDFVRVRRLRLRRGAFKVTGLLIVILVFLVGWSSYNSFFSVGNLVSSEKSKNNVSKHNNDKRNDFSDPKRNDSISESENNSSDSETGRSSVYSSSEESNNVPSSKSTTTDHSAVARYLAGKQFTIYPIAFDGEDINKAMDSGKAPVNTFHDGHIEGTFMDGERVKYSYVMGATDKIGTYIVSNGHLKLDNFSYTIPYYVNGDQVSFTRWVEKGQGHQVTMQIEVK